MENRKNAKKAILIAVVLLIVAALAVCLIFLCTRGAKAEPLTEYWSSDSSVAQSLRDYVKKVTDPKDEANFIPVKDRIAVFDMDGTLTCETYYTYYDTMMFIEFCLNDHPERVSDALKQVAASTKSAYKADETLARNFAKA